MRVLVTGAAGLIGGILLDGLSGEHEVRGIDGRRTRDQNVRRIDQTELEPVVTAFKGADVVVDLAASPDPGIPWKTVLRNNLPATLNAFEAAERAGVRRVIFASSNHVTGLYEKEHPYSKIVAGEYDGIDRSAIPLITASDPVRPDGPYGIGKAFGESAGRWQSERSGLSVICLRIGTVNAADRPKNPRHFSTLLTHADLVRLVDRSINAPDDMRFGIFYGVSNNTWRIWDIDDARQRIGYSPEDNTESFRGSG
jgi:nucleoside-diphosphate-sugar epimerase